MDPDSNLAFYLHLTSKDSEALTKAGDNASE